MHLMDPWPQAGKLPSTLSSVRSLGSHDKDRRARDEQCWLKCQRNPPARNTYWVNPHQPLLPSQELISEADHPGIWPKWILHFVSQCKAIQEWTRRILLGLNSTAEHTSGAHITFQTSSHSVLGIRPGMVTLNPWDGDSVLSTQFCSPHFPLHCTVA